jgi:3-deoxy-manno-octulosonate cytidylyltransferase (CMP-KDO synthetase)
MNVLGVIPARLKSTRLPEKMKRLVGGKPLIQHVWEKAIQVKGFSRVVIATDSDEILKLAQRFGAHAVMTREDHQSGTERLVEVAQKATEEVLINIQGDEPLVDPSSIEKLIPLFKDASLQVATLYFPMNSKEDYLNPNVVKVVLDHEGYALYFSRAPIPFYRETPRAYDFLKHLGVYAYRRAFLNQYAKLKPTELEL